MKSLNRFLLAGVLTMLVVLPVQAASVHMQWKNPQEYRDIQAANMSQSRFEERVIRELGKHFEDTARRLLPAGQVLEINVNDVDLAGDIEYFFHPDPAVQEMRVIRDLYFPRLDFSYVLTGQDGSVIKSGEAQAEDRTFYFFSEYMRDDPLLFEKRLIEKWFYRTFDAQIRGG